jgi:hypothetical protein
VVPIAAIPRQARRFDTEDGADLASTHFCDESLESRSLNQSRPGAPKILVDDDDVLKAELACVLDQTVLAPLTLLVMDDLTG